jgi:hypothetical protein
MGGLRRAGDVHVAGQLRILCARTPTGISLASKAPDAPEAAGSALTVQAHRLKKKTPQSLAGFFTGSSGSDD